LQEDLIHERFVTASLVEELRLSRSPSPIEAGPSVDINTLEPMQRRSQPLSMMKNRAAQILMEQRKEKANRA